VLGDVGNPQLAQGAPGEPAVDQIRGGGCLLNRPATLVAGQPLDTGAMHRHGHRTVSDRDAAPQGEFSVYPSAAVDAVGCGVHLPDLIGQPGMPERPG
jgi:hypothetical protein